MDIYVDGNRSSIENWAVAQAAPLSDLPIMNEQQKATAAGLGISEESYARSFYAGELESKFLAEKAAKVAQLVESLAQQWAPGLQIESVWLKTFEGKFRLDARWNGRSFLVFLREEVVDELFESGSRQAEEQIARVVEVSLLTAKAARAS